MKRLARSIAPHLVLVVFSAIIVLPLLWVVRVSLTDKLTAYKRPKHVEFRKELPKTNVGKILRRELR